MTTDKGLLGIRLNATPLALAILFSVAISASADDDLPTARDSVKVDAKPADAAAAAPRRQDADNPAPEHIDGIAEFAPRPGKHVIKVKRGWSGYLVFSKVIQDVHWTIVATQNIGAASGKVTNANSSNWRNVPVEPQTGSRRVRVLPRSATVPFNVHSYLSDNTTPPEQVTVISEGANIVVDGGPDGGMAIDLSADRIVIWIDATKPFSPEISLPPEQPLQLYLEGNVVIRQHSEQPQPNASGNNNVIRAARAFYDARANRVSVSNVELNFSIPSSDENFLSRADEIRRDSPKVPDVTVQGSRSLANELPQFFPSTDPVLKAVTLDEFSRFVAVRKGTATIRYHGQGTSGNSRCELQIEVEADTTEIDAALKEAIPQSQIKVTEVRSAALLTGTVPTDLDRLQADNIARQFYPDVITQLKIVTPPVTPPAPEITPARKPSPKTDPSPQKTKSGIRAELKQLRSEVQGLRQDIRELNQLLAKRTEREDQPKFELPTEALPEESEVFRNGLLSFEATWCGPCQQMKSIVNKLRKSTLPFHSIDVDTHPDLCKKFSVESIPCFVLVKDGREIDRVSGTTTEAKLKELMKKLEIERANESVPLSVIQLPRVLGLKVGEASVLTFDRPVSILTSKADVVVIERGSPKSARIRARSIGEVELQLVYRDTGNSERILIRVVDDHLARALSKTITLNINDQPLTEVLREFQRLVDANIYLDTKGLEDEGVSPDVKQSFEYSGVSARTALKLILKPLNLDFIEDNEVIKVTSRTRANGELYTVVYNVSDLVEAEEGNKPATTGQQLVESLQQVGDRDCWEAAGGAGTVRYMKETSSLVVRQTYSMHYKIGNYLADRRGPKKKEIIRGQQTDKQTDAAKFVVKVYSVADLVIPLLYKQDLAEPKADTNYWFQYCWFQLTDLIMKDVEPTCWISNGGKCSITSNQKTRSLVIRAPQVIHNQVATVLSRERNKMAIRVSFAVRMITASETGLGGLNGIDLKTDPEAKCIVLNSAQAKEVHDSLQASGAEIQYAPRITVVNGHIASLKSSAWPMKDGTSIDIAMQMRGLVAPDRRSVGVNLALNADADKIVEELTRRTINVAVGSSLLLDVTEELRAKSPGKTISGRAYLLIDPNALILEEDEEQLDAPRQARALMETPRGPIIEEEETLGSPSTR